MNYAYYLNAGISVIPVCEKRPVIKWKVYQTQRMTLEDAKWIIDEGNHDIAVVTGKVSNLVVVDYDDKEKAKEFFKKYRSLVRTIVLTRRGVHFAFQIGDREIRSSKFDGGDLKAEGGYCVWPPSPNRSFLDGYEFRPPSELCLLPDELIPAPRKIETFDEPDLARRIMRAREYVKRCDKAVSGQGGHNTTFRVASVLIQKFELTIDQALPVLLEWNDSLEEKWTVKELVHKLESAAKPQRSVQ